MIRELTDNEKSCNPHVKYVFERNGYKTWLNDDKFNQLAKEVLAILNKNTGSMCSDNAHKHYFIFCKYNQNF